VVENTLETRIDKLFVNIITKMAGIEPSRITNTLQNPDNEWIELMFCLVVILFPSIELCTVLKCFCPTNA
jgi:hypothetical protein